MSWTAFWVIFTFVAIAILILESVVCVIINLCNRNRDYKKLAYNYNPEKDKKKEEKKKGRKEEKQEKEKGKEILVRIDEFYNDKENIKRLLNNGSLFYRRAKLSNNLKSNGTWKEIFMVIGTAVLSGLMSSIIIAFDEFCEMLSNLGIEVNKNFLFIFVLIFTILGISCLAYDLYFRSMETRSDGLWRYELGYIDNIIKTHFKNNLPDEKEMRSSRLRGEITISLILHL